MTEHVLNNMNEVISYNYSQSHEAVDIVGAGHQVSDVIAYDDGVVEIVVKDVKYTNHQTSGSATYGNFVKIKHDNGLKTLYAHLKYGSVNVIKGQRTYKGQKIGTMGATGNAYGVHLHFEVRDNKERRLNPNDYLYTQKNEEVEVTPENNADSKENASTEVIAEETTVSDNLNIEESSNEEVETDDLNDKVESDIQKPDSNITLNESTPNTTSNKNDAEAVSTTYLKSHDYYGGSIVDGLKSIQIDSSFDNRAQIALRNGITNYRGTYNQNVYLLKLLKQGMLKA